MSRPNSRKEAEQDHELTRLFIANQLGQKPRRVAAQDAAIHRASVTLEASPLEEASRARRILAIEYTAWSTLAAGKSPTSEQLEQAIGIVDIAADEDVRDRARGGMVIRAAQGGWAARGGAA